MKTYKQLIESLRLDEVKTPEEKKKAKQELKEFVKTFKELIKNDFIKLPKVNTFYEEGSRIREYKANVMTYTAVISFAFYESNNLLGYNGYLTGREIHLNVLELLLKNNIIEKTPITEGMYKGYYKINNTGLGIKFTDDRSRVAGSGVFTIVII